MKKFALYIFLIVFIVMAVDLTFGYMGNRYIKNNPLPGDYRWCDYLLKESNDEIVVLGSSIAMNSLMPSIVEDSLNMTCFNGGANGQHIVYYRTMLECVLKRYTPKYVILVVKPDELSNGGMGRYNFLIPYYHQGYAVVDSCLEGNSMCRKLLMKSSLYRYNNIWFRILLYHFITPDEPGYKGFVGKSIPFVPTVMTSESGEKNISDNALGNFNRIVGICQENNIGLAVFCPPSYVKYKKTPKSITEMKSVCDSLEIPMFDDCQDSTFLAHNEYFHDNAHLSVVGARIYTEVFVSRFRQMLGR